MGSTWLLQGSECRDQQGTSIELESLTWEVSRAYMGDVGERCVSGETGPVFFCRFWKALNFSIFPFVLPSWFSFSGSVEQALV